MVQSCQVCRDNADAAPVRPRAPVPPPVEEEASNRLEPLIAGTPEYPAAARQRRVEGHVDVEFTVNPAGNVESPRVVAAQPSGILDRKSTRLNSSHLVSSYAVFCLKK